MSEILDIVNDQDEVIGQAERDEVHAKGLVCRLIYVVFYTPGGNVILQKRSDTKKNDAGKLTTTVSGHVSAGQTYSDAAVRETFEEAGVEVNETDLTFLGIVRADFVQGAYISNAMRGLFAYKFEGELSELKVEELDGAGFAVYNVDDLLEDISAEEDELATFLKHDVGREYIVGVKKLIDEQ